MTEDSFNNQRNKYFESFKLDETQVVVEGMSYLNNNVLTSEWEQIKVESDYVINKTLEDKKLTSIEYLFKEFDTNSQEGALLISLATTIINTPDYYTSLKIIEDKMKRGAWKQYINKKNSFIVFFIATIMQISTWFVNDTKPKTIWGQFSKRIGARIIYLLIKNVIKKTLNSYRIGKHIDDKKIKNFLMTHHFEKIALNLCPKPSYNFKEAEKNYQFILDSVDYIKNDPILNQADTTINFNFDALHPVCRSTNAQNVLKHVQPKIKNIIECCQKANIKATINPISSQQQDVFYILIEQLTKETEADTLEYLGVTLQAHSTRIIEQIKLFAELMKSNHSKMGLKLIKGDYWHQEKNEALNKGYPNHCVFTRKENTDLIYLSCAHLLLNNYYEFFDLTFGTHNIHTIKSLEHFSQLKPFTLEKSKGNGERIFRNLELSDQVSMQHSAPIGTQKSLSQYIKRKLFDNAQREFFTNKLNQQNKEIKKLSVAPVEKINRFSSIKNPKVPHPIYNEEGEQFRAQGEQFNFKNHALKVISELNQFNCRKYLVHSIVANQSDYSGEKNKHYSKIEPLQEVAEVIYINDAYHVDDAVKSAKDSLNEKQLNIDNSDKIKMLANHLENNRYQFADLCMREMGVDFKLAIQQVQNSIDYCFSYSREYGQLKNVDSKLENRELLPIGLVCCINNNEMRLSDIVKQIIAALITGNAVIIKPSSDNVITTFNLIQFLFKSEFDFHMIQYLISFNKTFEEQLINHSDVDLICCGDEKEDILLKKSLLIQNRLNPDKVIQQKKNNGVIILDSTVDIEQSIEQFIFNSNFNYQSECTISSIFINSVIKDCFLKALTERMETLYQQNDNIFEKDGYKKPPMLEKKSIEKSNVIEMLGITFYFIKPKDFNSLYEKIENDRNKKLWIYTKNYNLVKQISKNTSIKEIHVNKNFEKNLGKKMLVLKENECLLEERDYLLNFLIYKEVSI